jgi:membrane protease YdiL (CAAX protease family)
MSQMPEPADQAAPFPEVVPVRRGHPWIAWTVIVLLVIVVVVYQNVFAPELTGRGRNAAFIGTELLARYLVGVSALPGSEAQKTTLLAQARSLNTGPPEQRWCYVILTGELGGPKQALEQLTELNGELERNHFPLSRTEQEVQRSLGRLYADYEQKKWDAPSLAPEDKERLRQQLGWFGELALAPAGGDAAARSAALYPAYRAMIGFAGGALVLLALGLLGLIGLIVLPILWGLGIVRGRLGGPTNHSGVYAETFAVWMLLFIGLGVLTRFIRVPGAGLLFAGLADLFSLAALAWPVLRGIPWRQVRQDIGLTAGRPAALEPAIGVGCYAMAIPLILVGLIILLAWSAVQKSVAPAPPSNPFSYPPDTPTHPIVEIVPGSTWWLKLQIFLLASVIAPIVEETMFRGVLYRQVRDGTRRLGALGSAVLGATIVSFLFAVIHPQGPKAVPVLMMIAFALTIAREWRGTLVPGMVTHGIHNGVTLGILLLAVAD